MNLCLKMSTIFVSVCLLMSTFSVSVCLLMSTLSVSVCLPSNICQHFLCHFSLCARFGFPPKKFALCDFLPFPHFVRIFYVIFLKNFLIGLRIFCKEFNSYLLGNILVNLQGFEADKSKIKVLK